MPNKALPPKRVVPTVRYVVEALVIVPLVPQKVGRVAYVVEALVAVRFERVELPATTNVPPTLTLPEVVREVELAAPDV